MESRTKRARLPIYFAFAFVLWFVAQPHAKAIELIINGDFETGTFAGWIVTDLAGGSGSWFIDVPGTTTPLSGFPTSAAGGLPHGSFYAVTDQTGPGTHALEQSFIVPTGSSVVLSFDWFVNNQNSATIVGPQGLNHNGPPNQHARVDLLSAGSGPFDTGPTVLAVFYIGADPGPNPNPFTHYIFDITSLVGGGGVFDLRFAEVDNQFFLNAGVDNVSVNAIVAAAPEPLTLWLLAIAFAALGVSRRMRELIPLRTPRNGDAV